MVSNICNVKGYHKYFCNKWLEKNMSAYGIIFSIFLPRRSLTKLSIIGGDLVANNEIKSVYKNSAIFMLEFILIIEDIDSS